VHMIPVTVSGRYCCRCGTATCAGAHYCTGCGCTV
jgi:hypothetical protein